MKPEKIDWITPKGPLGPFPDEGKELLLSTQTPFLYGDTSPKVTEGSFQLCKGFVDRNGKEIPSSVYAWAYKPDCMMGKTKGTMDNKESSKKENKHLIFSDRLFIKEKTLSQAPSEPAEQEWISVDERLPEKGQWTLIYCWRGIIQASFWTRYWKMHELSIGGHEFTLDEVTHWMPLPKPPIS